MVIGGAEGSTIPWPTGPLLREFESLHVENDYILSDEVGALPEGLRGTLYRNGAGRWESGGSPVGHIFDGDGMLSMFVFDDGKVRFRNRYVRTSHYLRGNRSTGPAGRNTGTMRAGGSFWANAFRWPLSNLANTNAILHAGKLFALYEACRPYSINPDTLGTNGIYDFDGKLRGMGAFSAHPKIDHRTGEMFNFGTAIFPFPGLIAYRVDPAGMLHKLARITTARPLLNHDVGLTDRYMVFVLDPLIASVPGMITVVAGVKPLVTAIHFDPSLGTRVVLVPRGGGKQRTAYTDALLHFHLGNCYDDGDDTVIELCRYTNSFDDVWQHLHTGFRQAQAKNTIGGPFTRLRITKNDRVIREELTDCRTEFPRFDDRVTGQPNRYSYAVQFPDVDLTKDEIELDESELKAANIGSATNITEIPRLAQLFHMGISTFDHKQGTESTYHVDNYGSIGEPVFAPRSKDALEGDGWLLTIEYDRADHRSKLVVLNAQDPSRGPIYVGGLRHHLPAGIHGSFTSRIAQPV